MGAQSTPLPVNGTLTSKVSLVTSRRLRLSATLPLVLATVLWKLLLALPATAGEEMKGNMKERVDELIPSTLDW